MYYFMECNVLRTTEFLTATTEMLKKDEHALPQNNILYVNIESVTWKMSGRGEEGMFKTLWHKQ